MCHVRLWDLAKSPQDRLNMSKKIPIRPGTAPQSGATGFPTAVAFLVETSVKSPRKLHVCIVPTCSWDAHITERLNGILMTTSLPNSSVVVSAETWVKSSQKLYVCILSKYAYIIKASQKYSTLSKGLGVRGKLTPDPSHIQTFKPLYPYFHYL